MLHFDILMNFSKEKTKFNPKAHLLREIGYVLFSIHHDINLGNSSETSVNCKCFCTMTASKHLFVGCCYNIILIDLFNITLKRQFFDIILKGILSILSWRAKKSLIHNCSINIWQIDDERVIPRTAWATVLANLNFTQVQVLLK